MSVEDNRALARRFVREIFNQGNLDVVEEIVSPGYLHHDPTTDEFGSGIEGFKEMIALYRSAFPDLHISMDDQIATEDKVVDRWTGSGTHRGTMMGISPTNRKVEATGISIHRIADGKIAETWNNYDALGIFQQLGAIPDEPDQR